jgi:hypothetical protein
LIHERLDAKGKPLKPKRGDAMENTNTTTDAPRDYSAEFDAVCNEACEKLADELTAIDKKYGIQPYDYSVLRKEREANA